MPSLTADTLPAVSTVAIVISLDFQATVLSSASAGDTVAISVSSAPTLSVNVVLLSDTFEGLITPPPLVPLLVYR
nr:MAG TPA: hypothetical protein [Caudoviricetes sp.]